MTSVNDSRFSNIEDFYKVGTKKETPFNLEYVGRNKKVPIGRTVDFWVGVGASSKSLSARRANWRSINASSWGGLDFSQNPVKDSVLLIPNDKTLKIEGGWNLDTYKENLGGAGTLLDILNGIQEVFNNTKVVPVWKPKLFQDLKEMKMGGDFEFNFNFGAAGEYNAFEEVVKPIYALLNFFSLGSSDAGIDAATATVSPPFPTKNQFIREKIKGAFTAITTDGLNFSDLATLNSSLQNAIQAGAHAVATSESYNNLWITWGRFTFGPMAYSDISYSFDMDNFDTDGWPISGKFRIGGVESMRMATTNALNSTIIKGL